ncbi:MAG: O-antigen ligase family protein [Anaerolineae bacterium]|nr:O-antigen ligase family protein [Anaerolineae bacterium]
MALWLLLVWLIPLGFNPVSRWHFEPDKAAFLLLLAGLLAGGGVALPRRAVRWPLALYTLAAALATAFSVAPAVSVWGAPGWRFGLLTWLALALTFLAAAGQLRRAGARRRVIDALLVGSAPACAYAALQAAGLDPLLLLGDNLPRVYATFGHANFFAAYLAMVAPLTLARAISARSRRARLLWSALLAAQAASVALTLSRSGWLAMAAALGMVALAWAWRAGRRRLVVALLMGAAAVAALLLVLSAGPPLPGSAPHLLQTLTAVFRTDSPTVQIRFLGWEAAGRMIADRPLLGFGPGTYGLALDAYYPPGLAPYGGAKALGGHPHNLPLEVGAAVGLPGAAAYFWLVGAVLWGMWRGARGRRGLSVAQVAVLAAGVAGLVTSLLEFETVGASMVFWLLAGMSEAGEARRVRVPRAAGAALGAAGAVCALAIVTPDILGGLAERAPPTQAIALAAWADRTSPTPGDYGAALGLYHAEAGQWVEGEAVLRALATSPPAVAHAARWRALGDFYIRQAWNDAGARASAFAAAAAAYGEAIARAPTNPDLWLDRGMAYLELGEHQAARADFVRAAALAPDYARAVGAMGEYHLAVGDRATAQAAFARADALREAWALFLWRR